MRSFPGLVDRALVRTIAGWVPAQLSRYPMVREVTTQASPPANDANCLTRYLHV